MIDPDKIRAFRDEENPARLVGQIQKTVLELQDLTDLVAKARSAKISDNRINICQDLLKAYRTTIFAYGDAPKIGKLSTDQQREILVLVDDILRGKRETVQFQLTRNCDGIKELFTSKIFTIK